MTTINIKIQTAGTHTRDIDLAAIEGTLIDFLDTSEDLDAGLGCPDARSLSIELVPEPEKIVGFDFEADTFVSVQAPEGTDPDTLHEQAIALFKERLAAGDFVVRFHEIFDED
jgi:hypothetical protein